MDTIVMYPSIGISHIMPMVELAKQIQSHHPSFSITILITPQPFADGVAATEAAIANIAATFPSITFVHLTSSVSLPAPPPSPPSPSLHFNLASMNNPLLYHTLQSIGKSANIKALVIDFFNSPAFDVSSVLDIPTYVYHTSSAGALAIMLYMPVMHRLYTKSFKDYEEDISVDIPGLPPVSISHMSNALVDRSSNFYNHFLNLGRQLPRAKGFLVNAFTAFQPDTLKTISDGLCIPNGPTPPIFPVGPLIATKPEKNNLIGDSRPECLRWLDKQPQSSIVFLCFGSMGVFPLPQLHQIATALENITQRFLWVVRPPLPDPVDDHNHIRSTTAYSVASVLPEGFLERTKDRGFVVDSWAPQVEVLAHGATGGFVTHCGWNSVLEAVWHGVPMVAWPLYAEQKTNKLFLVEQAKVAVGLKWEKDGSVRAEELETKVRELMEGDEGKRVRENAREMKAAARAALEENGSSTVALEGFVRMVKGE
ncbi:hypothetical protein Droror1_Dr00013165 [Drosera rotundifolia]